MGQEQVIPPAVGRPMRMCDFGISSTADGGGAASVAHPLLGYMVILSNFRVGRFLCSVPGSPNLYIISMFGVIIDRNFESKFDQSKLRVAVIDSKHMVMNRSVSFLTRDGLIHKRVHRIIERLHATSSRAALIPMPSFADYIQENPDAFPDNFELPEFDDGGSDA